MDRDRFSPIIWRLIPMPKPQHNVLVPTYFRFFPVNLEANLSLPHQSHVMIEQPRSVFVYTDV